LRNGAHELISRVVEEELRVFLEQQAGRREADGRFAVVRIGYQPERNTYSWPEAGSGDQLDKGIKLYLKRNADKLPPGVKIETNDSCPV
jgi:hypothetical protein